MTSQTPDEQKPLQELLQTLRRTRDELRLQVHLASKDLRDEWESLENQYEDWSRKIEPATSEATDAAGDVWQSLKLIGEELKTGFDRVRRAL